MMQAMEVILSMNAQSLIPLQVWHFCNTKHLRNLLCSIFLNSICIWKLKLLKYEYAVVSWIQIPVLPLRITFREDVNVREMCSYKTHSLISWTSHYRGLMLSLMTSVIRLALISIWCSPKRHQKCSCCTLLIGF